MFSTEAIGWHSMVYLTWEDTVIIPSCLPSVDKESVSKGTKRKKYRIPHLINALCRIHLGQPLLFCSLATSSVVAVWND